MDASVATDAEPDAPEGSPPGDAAGDAPEGSPPRDAAGDATSDADIDADPPTGCACGSAERCADAGGCLASNDLCSQAIDATLGGTWTGSVCNADDTEQLSCGSAGRADVYFYLGSAGDYLVRVAGDFLLATFGECPRAANPSLCISPFPSSLTTIVASGETWIILEPRGACGSYTFQVVPL